MKTNFFVGITVAAVVYLAVVVTVQYINSKEEKREDPIPQLLILPPPPEIEPLEFHPLHDNIAQPKFEIKIQNESEDEVLEMVATLSDAKEYIKEYGQYHEDLFVYNIKTKKLVLTNNKND